MTFAEDLQVIEAIGSVATVVLVALAWQQIRLLRIQATTAFEDGLSAQYRRIMRHIPTSIWLGSQLEALSGEAREECKDAIYRYLDLSNEQTFLHMKKRVCDETWLEWSKGIRGNLQLPAFQAVWSEVAAAHPHNFTELRSITTPTPRK